ncbi:MAG: DUF86 domain-containing protein [Hymenobacteraceae bacterium]|nr:DUF86 domain-containing protein [Hymenobacteraceae bacterium]MDX5395233.1 DUF86 domain-containing protein [Hymenobacteraceae bacterium]MDX5511271.1 DUF86 domain-containing protein [Hymenobacteraceae bacterium]
MEERVEKWLLDIKAAIAEIDFYYEDQPRSFESFTNNLMLRRAVERNLEIIGEAMNRILAKDPDFPIENAKRIVGLRNQLIHGYDNISFENIWAILINHLPKLKITINKLIENSNP